MTASGDQFYFTGWGVTRFTAGDPIEKSWVPDDPAWFAISGLTVNGDHLFYGGYGCDNGYVDGYGECPPAPIGAIRRVDLATGGAYTSVATGLGQVGNVRVDRATGLLYVLEYGTDAGHYWDGRLLVVDPSP